MELFWNDRYHATLIEDGKHFWNCSHYIDLNMVRAESSDRLPIGLGRLSGDFGLRMRYRF